MNLIIQKRIDLLRVTTTPKLHKSMIKRRSTSARLVRIGNSHDVGAPVIALRKHGRAKAEVAKPPARAERKIIIVMMTRAPQKRSSPPLRHHNHLQLMMKGRL
jgi:hypothetical protein